MQACEGVRRRRRAKGACEGVRKRAALQVLLLARMRVLRVAAMGVVGATLWAAPGAGAFVPEEKPGGKCVTLPAGGLCSPVMGNSMVWQFPGTDLAALDATVKSETNSILTAAGGVASQACKINFLFLICATW